MAKQLIWEKVANQLRSGDMPPAGKERPTEIELDVLNAWLDSEVFSCDCSPTKNLSRPVTVRRLNRIEYNNTLRDLIGLDLHLADEFPADDIGYGFDNNGDVLSLSPLLIEKYLAAAEKAIDAAFQSSAIRERLLNPPPDDIVPATYRAFTQSVREEPRKVLRTGPADAPPAPTSQEQELARAYNILRAFADRAFRRPITHEELTRVLHFVESAQRNGEDFEQGLHLALRAVLVSPHFLYRFELENGGKATSTAWLNDFELAARLSYFLWSSLPDEELFALAAQGRLHMASNLTAQVQRMLKDSKAHALVESFAGQWLQTRSLKDLMPDPNRFPAFDEPLRVAMLKETELFFETNLRENRRITDLLDADFTFVNERLARHYGISGVRGDEFRRVSLTGTDRGGLLTQASILAVTSNPTRTSPVKRGKWILENILGTPPPPPPPGVEDLRDDRKAELSGTIRQRMEQHRTNPNCASCHQRMDPLGFGLENFDAIGAWRTQEGGLPIDSTGILPGGQAFQGPRELRAYLISRREAFARCLAEKLLTYALGRGAERGDRCTVNHIVRQTAANDYRLGSLIFALVESDAFQKRGSERSQP